MIAAILRAQWLSMRSFRLDSRRRGAIFSLITALVWYGFWAGLGFAAESFTSSAEAVELLPRVLPSGFMFIFLYWQLTPIISASLGASLDLKKLLIYPVPHGKLFAIEVLLRLTTCAEMLLVLAGALIGICGNPVYGGITAVPRVVAAFFLFTAFNLLLSAGLRSLLERLLTHKGLREVWMLAMVFLAALPQLLLVLNVPIGSWWRRVAEAIGFWPWTAVADIALRQDAGRALLLLGGWLILAFAFGYWQFERSLRYDAQATAVALPRGARRSRPVIEWLYRLPSAMLPDPMAAMVEKEIRMLSRTPRFRTVFIMGFSFGLFIWVPMAIGRGGSHSVVSDNFLTIVSVYALTLLGQVTYLNTFGFDRSATQLYFSAPVSFRTTLVAKNIAAALCIFFEMCLVVMACRIVRIGIGYSKVGEAFLVTAITGLYVLAMGNLSSVHFPRSMNPERVSQGAAASRFQALIFLLYPFALLPVVLAFWARHVFSSDLIFYLILAFAAVLGMVFYWIAMDSAAGTALERREKILMELSRGEGPISD